MKIEIQRAALMDGEELMDFAKNMSRAVMRSAETFGGEPGNLFLAAIYKTTVVARDIGQDRFVQAAWRRKGEEISFSKAVVVRPSWEEVGQLQQSEGQPDVRREAEPEVVEVTGPGFWSDLI